MLDYHLTDHRPQTMQTAQSALGIAALLALAWAVSERRADAAAVGQSSA
jgi:hypothetical protein